MNWRIIIGLTIVQIGGMAFQRMLLADHAVIGFFISWGLTLIGLILIDNGYKHNGGTIG